MRRLVPLALLVVVAACGGGGEEREADSSDNGFDTFAEDYVGGATEATPEPEPEADPEPAPKTKPQRVSELPGDGTFEVGVDVPPGTYRNDGARGGYPYCVVYASKQPNDLDSYLRGSTSKGPATVSFNKGEWANTAYCKPFRPS